MFLLVSLKPITKKILHHKSKPAKES
uniref:Uncharacterized protein n=1 Tax=Arundo donax TaxID=35708 RepID=A0A0A9H6N2_ARUDO